MITLACPAKVNLALSVGSPRASDGYHPIASWMISLDYADELILEKQTGSQAIPTLHRQFTRDAPKPQPIDWPPEADLAYRAHQALSKYVGEPLPVEMILNKRIPAGAGLAGGSSNAAAVLVGLNQLFALRLDGQALIRLAMTLGSDIAFLVAALLGQPAAIVTGLGETITPIAPQSLHLVLIFPSFGCATGPVYKTFDQLLTQADKPADVSRVQSLANEMPLNPSQCFNDLAEPACIVEPQLQTLRGNLANLTAQPVHVSGSGSTLFVIAADAVQANQMAQQVTEQTQLPAIATQSLV